MLVQLFENLQNHIADARGVEFAEAIAPSLSIARLWELSFDESGLQIKKILESSYTDGITGFEDVQNDGTTITGIFLDQILPNVTKRYKFTITPDNISYQLENPDDLDNANFSELEFAATKMFGGSKKPKNCTKGTACGNGCISKSKRCNIKPSPQQKEDIKKVLGTDSSLPKDATKYRNNILQKVKTAGGFSSIDDLRKELPDLPKEEFDNLLKEMQSKGDIYLENGSKPEELLSKQEKDSAIKSEIRGYLRFVSIPKDKSDSSGEKSTSKKDEKDVTSKDKNTKVKNYDDFSKEAEKVFSSLEKEHRGLVPIWKMREEMNVPREDFDSWLKQMQADGKFYLQTGEHKGATKYQKENGIISPIRGGLFYVTKN